MRSVGDRIRDPELLSLGEINPKVGNNTGLSGLVAGKIKRGAKLRFRSARIQKQAFPLTKLPKTSIFHPTAGCRVYSERKCTKVGDRRSSRAKLSQGPESESGGGGGGGAP